MRLFIALLYFLLLHLGAFGQFNTIKSHEATVVMKETDKIYSDTALESSDMALDTTAVNIKYERDNVFFLPLKSIVLNSQFGNRFHPLLEKMKFHSGLDLKATYEAVYAISDGYAKTVAFGSSEGNYIVLQHNSIESVYCHLATVLVKQGERVRGGTCIGISGNTGLSTGPHLHFGLKVDRKAVNPMYYLININTLNSARD